MMQWQHAVKESVSRVSIDLDNPVDRRRKHPVRVYRAKEMEWWDSIGQRGELLLVYMGGNPSVPLHQ